MEMVESCGPARATNSNNLIDQFAKVERIEWCKQTNCMYTSYVVASTPIEYRVVCSWEWKQQPHPAVVANKNIQHTFSSYIITNLRGAVCFGTNSPFFLISLEHNETTNIGGFIAMICNGKQQTN